ncbi:MAG: methionine--tRNA ligase [Desulfurivibrionaceae bacterium]
MNTYITTPIFYVNDHPHLGHAYTILVADVYSRYRRLGGDNVFFQTGTDEHGDKIVQAAEKAGMSPKEYADRISESFRTTWPELDIEADNFIRTTDQEHIKTVQKILQKVYDKGDIYLSEYSGHYCKGCERFLTEKELVEGQCPDHLSEPEEIHEENYFFRMSRYQDWLIDHINQHPEFITPERYRNEVLSFLQDPLEDLCISRPVSRLTWGVELPFDKNFVTYVWFDALINYLTGLGYPDQENFRNYWPAAEHIIAKDILKPHAVYWPTMLKAIGLNPFRRLRVHGFWKVGETKMSKTIGNVARPGEMVATFGVDPVRYFLLREMSFGLDANYTPEALIDRYNSDLANDLGNLFSRSLTMVQKFSDGRVPESGEPAEEDRELSEAGRQMLISYQREMKEFNFSRALAAVWEMIGRANRYIVHNAPWEMAKDPEKKKRLNTFFFHLLESLRLISLTLLPFMPTTGAKMLSSLGLKAEDSMPEHLDWGLLEPGTEVKKGEALFPRLEKMAKHKGSAEKEEHQKNKQLSGKGEKEGVITFDDFKKCDLRVAEIIRAEKVKKSDRLLKLTVKAPEERVVVAGIAEHYAPEELIGKKVIVVANLQPTKLMGVRSEGMILAARDGERLYLPEIPGEVGPGSSIS